MILLGYDGLVSDTILMSLDYLLFRHLLRKHQQMHGEVSTDI